MGLIYNDLCAFGRELCTDGVCVCVCTLDIMHIVRANGNSLVPNRFLYLITALLPPIRL